MTVTRVAAQVLTPESDASRLASLDAFRGFTIAAMMIVNNPGDWKQLYGPLGHAPWHGWTFTDLVFPFFLFIAGVAMTLSLVRRAPDTSAAGLTWHLMRRGLIIISIGLALNALPSFEWASLRLPGVLQRIGLCVMLAAPIVVYATSWRTVAAWALGLMAAYAVIQLGIPVPGADGVQRTGSLLPGQDVGAWLDRWLMEGHLWRQSRTWDPEGLLSTLPALASLLAGALTGQWLATARKPLQHTWAMAWAGLACLLTGALLDSVLMPINKNLWTPSYVMLSTGWALLGFALCHGLLDARPDEAARRRWRRWCLPLIIYGMNALFLFALASLLGRLLSFVKWTGADGSITSLRAWLYAPIAALPVTPPTASLIYATGFMLVMFGVAWWMWQRRWFVKV